MRAVSVKYHEKMFYFWYGKNSVLRDYHGKKYNQLLSLPETDVWCGIKFRSYKKDIVLAMQSIAAVELFVLVMLGIVAQFA